MPLILGANSVSGYTVKNSLRFNSGSSDYLNRTLGTPTSRRIWTTSFWVKRSQLSTEQYMFLNAYNDGTNRQTNFTFTNDALELQLVTGGAYSGRIITNALYRDISAWYHVILAIDTTQATDTNRIKLYVNGSQVTSFSTATYPAQNFDTSLANTRVLYIGATSTPTASFNGYLSEYYFIDGQQLTPSSFGETDTASGIWIPKAYSGSHGTNGFYLKFANSASLGTDSSGNGNTWTVNNLTSIDQTTDTPTNNFATFNALFPSSATLTEGNLACTTNTDGNMTGGTFGASSGKWYAEIKYTGSGTPSLGIASVGLKAELGSTSDSYGYMSSAQKYNNGSMTSYGSSYTTNDIIGIALDLDNGTLIFYKNGVSQGTAFTSISGTFTFGGSRTTATQTSFTANFGNPPYSANSYTDGAGYGNFSYAVPSGYYALNTKNLANFG